MGCLSCGRGLHSECPIGCSICHSQSQLETESESEENEDWRLSSKRGSRGKGKRDETLRDQQSTGRKRAALAFPLDRSAPCEWLGLRYAGGGEHPILGCLDGKQQARHHGPSKNTLDNDFGNVHRICHSCHNRWHTLNDPEYDWTIVQKPHDSQTVATPQQQLDDMKFWANRATVKAKD
jgi:hypothetical protein